MHMKYRMTALLVQELVDFWLIKKRDVWLVSSIGTLLGGCPAKLGKLNFQKIPICHEAELIFGTYRPQKKSQVQIHKNVGYC